MRRILIFIVGLSCLESHSQIKLHIADSSVVYSPCYEYPEIDSLVFIQLIGEIAVCDPYFVYYDKNFKQFAYTSETKGDTCYVNHYWRNGNLKRRTTYVQMGGMPEWWHDEVYCENGRLLFYGPSLNQPGHHHNINYYCNGNKRNEFYHNGFGAEGTMTWWHENGQIQSESFFAFNEPAGTWKYYDLNGKLEKTERYEMGVLTKTETFNKD
jgi:antitoxin component YwqK of YwqJK toxin-antitoxin module